MRFVLDFVSLSSRTQIRLKSFSSKSPSKSKNSAPSVAEEALWLHFRSHSGSSSIPFSLHCFAFLLALKNNEFDDGFTILMVFGLSKDGGSELFWVPFSVPILDLFVNSLSDLLCAVICAAAVLKRLILGSLLDPPRPQMVPKSSPDKSAVLETPGTTEAPWSGAERQLMAASL